MATMGIYLIKCDCNAEWKLNVFREPIPFTCLDKPTGYEIFREPETIP